MVFGGHRLNPRGVWQRGHGLRRSNNTQCRAHRLRTARKQAHWPLVGMVSIALGQSASTSLATETTSFEQIIERGWNLLNFPRTPQFGEVLKASDLKLWSVSTPPNTSQSPLHGSAVEAGVTYWGWSQKRLVLSWNAKTPSVWVASSTRASDGWQVLSVARPAVLDDQAHEALLWNATLQRFERMESGQSFLPGRGYWVRTPQPKDALRSTESSRPETNTAEHAQALHLKRSRAPGGLGATLSGTMVQLWWQRPTRFDDDSVIPPKATVSFRIFQNGEPIAELTSTEYRGEILPHQRAIKYQVSATVDDGTESAPESVRSHPVFLSMLQANGPPAPGQFEAAAALTGKEQQTRLPRTALSTQDDQVYAHVALVGRPATGGKTEIQYTQSPKAGRAGSFRPVVPVATLHADRDVLDLALTAHADLVAIAWLEEATQPDNDSSELYVVQSQDGGQTFSLPRRVQSNGNRKRALDAAYDRYGDHHLVWSEARKMYYLKNLEGTPSSVFDVPKREVATEVVRYKAFYEPSDGKPCRCEDCWCEESYRLNEAHVERIEECEMAEPALHVDGDILSIIARQSRIWDNQPVLNPAWVKMTQHPVYSDVVIQKQHPTRMLVGWRSVWKPAFEPGDDPEGDGVGYQHQYLYSGAWHNQPKIKIAQRPLKQNAWAQTGGQAVAQNRWSGDPFTAWRISEVASGAAVDGWPQRPARPRLYTAPDGTLAAVFERSPSVSFPAPSTATTNGLVSSPTLGTATTNTLVSSPTLGTATTNTLVSSPTFGTATTNGLVSFPAPGKAPANMLVSSSTPDTATNGLHGADAPLTPSAETSAPARPDADGTRLAASMHVSYSLDGGLSWSPAQRGATDAMPQLAILGEGMPGQRPSLSVHDGLFFAAWRRHGGPSGGSHIVTARASNASAFSHLEVQADTKTNPHQRVPMTIRAVNKHFVPVNLKGSVEVSMGGHRDPKHEGSAVSSTATGRTPLRFELEQGAGRVVLPQGETLSLALRESHVTPGFTELQPADSPPHPTHITGETPAGNYENAVELRDRLLKHPPLADPTAKNAGVAEPIGSIGREQDAYEDTLREEAGSHEATNDNDNPGHNEHAAFFYQVEYLPNVLLEDLGSKGQDAPSGLPDPLTARDAHHLAGFDRVWAYTQGITLAQLATASKEYAPKARGMARYLCHRAVREPNTAVILGWPFSWNTKDDGWQDARLVTGANAWVVHGLGVFLTSSAYLEGPPEEQKTLKDCYHNALLGLQEHRLPVAIDDGRTASLMSAGWTTRGLEEASTPHRLQTPGTRDIFTDFGPDHRLAYYSVLDAMGYADFSPTQIRVCTLGKPCEERTSDDSAWQERPLTDEAEWVRLKTPVKAHNVVTEHNLDVLSVLNHALNHANALGPKGRETKQDWTRDLENWRDEVQDGVFNLLFDEHGWRDEFVTTLAKLKHHNTPWIPLTEAQARRQTLRIHNMEAALESDSLGRVITGGTLEREPAGTYRFTASPHVAIDNCSWLSLSVKDIGGLYAKRLGQCLEYTVLQFVKDLSVGDEDCDPTLVRCPPRRTYRGTHYFQNAFKDPYIEPSALQEASYHLEATMGLIWGLYKFVHAHPEYPAADTLLEEAHQLWAGAQAFVRDHGFLYSSQRIQDLSARLVSSTAIVWFIDVYNYIEQHVDPSLQPSAIAHRTLSEWNPIHFVGALLDGIPSQQAFAISDTDPTQDRCEVGQHVSGETAADLVATGAYTLDVDRRADCGDRLRLRAQPKNRSGPVARPIQYSPMGAFGALRAARTAKTILRAPKNLWESSKNLSFEELLGIAGGLVGAGSFATLSQDLWAETEGLLWTSMVLLDPAPKGAWTRVGWVSAWEVFAESDQTVRALPIYNRNRDGTWETQGHFLDHVLYALVPPPVYAGPKVPLIDSAIPLFGHDITSKMAVYAYTGRVAQNPSGEKEEPQENLPPPVHPAVADSSEQIQEAVQAWLAAWYEALGLTSLAPSELRALKTHVRQTYLSKAIDRKTLEARYKTLVTLNDVMTELLEGSFARRTVSTKTMSDRVLLASIDQEIDLHHRHVKDALLAYPNGGSTSVPESKKALLQELEELLLTVHGWLPQRASQSNLPQTLPVLPKDLPIPSAWWQNEGRTTIPFDATLIRRLRPFLLSQSGPSRAVLTDFLDGLDEHPGFQHFLDNNDIEIILVPNQEWLNDWYFFGVEHENFIPPNFQSSTELAPYRMPKYLRKPDLGVSPSILHERMLIQTAAIFGGIFDILVDKNFIELKKESFDAISFELGTKKFIVGRPFIQSRAALFRSGIADLFPKSRWHFPNRTQIDTSSDEWYKIKQGIVVEFVPSFSTEFLRSNSKERGSTSLNWLLNEPWLVPTFRFRGMKDAAYKLKEITVYDLNQLRKDSTLSHESAFYIEAILEHEEGEEALSFLAVPGENGHHRFALRIADENLSEEFKDASLRGEAIPLVFTELESDKEHTWAEEQLSTHLANHPKVIDSPEAVRTALGLGQDENVDVFSPIIGSGLDRSAIDTLFRENLLLYHLVSAIQYLDRVEGNDPSVYLPSHTFVILRRPASEHQEGGAAFGFVPILDSILKSNFLRERHLQDRLAYMVSGLVHELGHVLYFRLLELDFDYTEVIEHFKDDAFLREVVTTAYNKLGIPIAPTEGELGLIWATEALSWYLTTFERILHRPVDRDAPFEIENLKDVALLGEGFELIMGPHQLKDWNGKMIIRPSTLFLLSKWRFLPAFVEDVLRDYGYDEHDHAWRTHQDQQDVRADIIEMEKDWRNIRNVPE